MGRNSGGVGSFRNNNISAEEHNAKLNMDVQSIKEGIMSYQRIDRWNNNSSYAMGFNADAQSVIEDVAKGDYGLATEIAKRAVENPNFDKYGSNLSEKQAYVIAKAAYDNKLIKSEKVIFDKRIREKVERDAQRKRQETERKKEEYNKTYQRSSTKVEVGSSITNSKGLRGTISRIITKSSGYVEVTYENGTKGKEMAFNLFGNDGNPLKKKKF